MAAFEYQALVIGAGQAGPSLAVRLANSGLKVAIVERHQFGGTCVNTGCIPTKTLVASAYAAHLARRAAEYGVSIDGTVTVDMKAVKARKDRVSEGSRSGLERWLGSTPNCTVYRGHTRFESDHEVRVGEDLLKADRIFLNVGGRAAIPAIPGLETIRYLTNSSMMDIDYLPQRLIIIGGSYIALEFGQMYRRFGSEVTVLERGPRLLGKEDQDVSDEILQIFHNEQIDVRLNTACTAVSKVGDDVEVQTDCASQTATVRGSDILIATGRRPNTDDLGLERTSIVRDKRGYIQVDDELRTSATGVWALGDCNGRGAFTHTSYNDYEIVAANLCDGAKRRVSDRITAYALYIDPPLGRVGMTEAEIQKTGRQALVGKRPMTKVGRAVEKGETQGFMKIIVDAQNKEILGAAILGTSGDEAIHCILDTMYSKAPYTTLQQAMHIHPTVSELIPTILGELHPLQNSQAQDQPGS
jgi:pyruvate/2-oxoglutarate dehydrogenase complex dihydrolipoamide dehydrogenase (E3) component